MTLAACSRARYVIADARHGGMSFAGDTETVVP
jgi:hypothetical protein